MPVTSPVECRFPPPPSPSPSRSVRADGAPVGSGDGTECVQLDTERNVAPRPDAPALRRRHHRRLARVGLRRRARAVDRLWHSTHS